METGLDGEWNRTLREVANENGHGIEALKSLPEEEWRRLLGFVVARMSNLGYVPMTGWQESLSTWAGRPSG